MAPSKIEQGHGRVVLHNDGYANVFSDMSATYPLKLLSPQLPSPNVSVVYMLSYGGGLVGGDRVVLDVEVHDGARLAILSQGSTKVFKARPGQRLSARWQLHPVTTQRLAVRVAPRSALFLLPDPVTCFRAAKYHQIQTFHLSKDSSAVLLDWITSGRKSLGEEWVFSKYLSLNEVWIEGKRVAKDSLLLEERDSLPGPLTPRTLAESLAPYSCYATLIMYGMLLEDTICHLTAAYTAITVFKQHAPPPLLWSLSPICEGRGCVVRVAAKETEHVRSWIGNALKDLEGVLGVDVYRRAFA
ncbi:UreD-domain-containing protein [Lentinus tigrinus ALCF2SS1-7]|uniref:UreD-domain-containing protein n=1 Tax=Lentinus tigrinus ALCF2SS1-6 TaxID=1328759 RepID=A0A5C2SNK7_9APHY|nr:UreD-domain-containing protein [Lentinus tigrinus ALCF2SS1-6]RPD81948.1 UreD-domain-containing protein [Lentinus tigrinus ALCF2SS1-7]